MFGLLVLPFAYRRFARHWQVLRTKLSARAVEDHPGARSGQYLNCQHEMSDMHA
jgi:hypothetical protein